MEYQNFLELASIRKTIFYLLIAFAVANHIVRFVASTADPAAITSVQGWKTMNPLTAVIGSLERYRMKVGDFLFSPIYSCPQSIREECVSVGNVVRTIFGLH